MGPFSSGKDQVVTVAKGRTINDKIKWDYILVWSINKDLLVYTDLSKWLIDQINKSPGERKISVEKKLQLFL